MSFRRIVAVVALAHLVTLATPEGQVAQRSATTPAQKQILDALELPEPPRFFDFTASTTS
jgi:hypothetical protein